MKTHVDLKASERILLKWHDMLVACIKSDRPNLTSRQLAILTFVSLYDDDIAMAWGRMLGCGCTVQVWRGTTCVATIMPEVGYYGSLPEGPSQPL